MTFRTQDQFEAARHLPVRWGARTWCPRITRLSALFNSKSSPHCRPSRRTPEVVWVWRRLSKPVPGETDPPASQYRQTFILSPIWPNNPLTL